MSSLVLYSSKNSKGKKDATGAFIPEAEAFAEYWNTEKNNIIGIPLEGMSKKKRRELTIASIKESMNGTPLNLVALFGHGWPSGIQFGFGMKEIPELADCLVEHCAYNARIVLYACLTAENSERDNDHEHVGPATDGGFADILRDELAKRGMIGWIDAHKTAGHTTWNPYVVRFDCEDLKDIDMDFAGGYWLVQPRSPHWKKWREALKGDMRFRFPMMTEKEIFLTLDSQ